MKFGKINITYNTIETLLIESFIYKISLLPNQMVTLLAGYLSNV